MKSQTAQNIMKFLARLDLKGAEVPAFIEAMHALEQICLDTPESRALNNAAADARDMPSGATKQPDQFKGD